MRVVTLLLLAVSALSAEFLQIEVTFEDIGCASCVESLQGRLARVRGVAKVEVDAQKRTALLELQAGNQVRLAPLLSRITQDGTKVTGVAVSARGAIESTQQGLSFQPSGLSQSYRLQLPPAAKIDPRPGVVYTIRGTVEEPAASGDPLLRAESVVESHPAP
jgi:copper chaperone CopZ